MNWEPQAVRDAQIRVYRTLCKEQRRLLRQARWHLRGLRYQHAIDAAKLADAYGEQAARVAADLGREP